MQGKFSAELGRHGISTLGVDKKERSGIVVSLSFSCLPIG
jgi:hypothetical protein